MVKINKIYTKNGDKGTTHLVGGDRIEKCSVRIDAVGDIDELNAYLGLVRTTLETKYKREFVELLSVLQNDLFDIGSIVATPPGVSWSGMRVITPEKIQFLETWIDTVCEDIPELTSFVLPGGTMLNSYLHIARAVCRRAERKLWLLSNLESQTSIEYSLDSNLLIYINRLSDLLFALSRYDIFDNEKTEYLWK